MMSVFEDSDWNLKAPHPTPPPKKIKKLLLIALCLKKIIQCIIKMKYIQWDR